MPGVKWCLPPADADEFKRGIISGEIDPLKLAEMNSKNRRAFFANWFGDSTGAAMNVEFEKSLLLKNQQQGMVNWAKRMMAKEPAKKRDDMISRIQKLDKVLDAKDEDAFLADLAAQKLGVGVSFDEAKKISDMSKKVENAREKMAAGGDRMEYGHAVVDLRNYVNGLTMDAEKFTMADAKANPAKAAGKLINAIASNAKSIKASMDNSAIFRQGWKTLWSHPGIWQNNARQSFVDLAREFGGHEVMDEVNADIVSRPTYDLMQQAKLGIGVHEEAYPTSLPEKIPVLGRAYKATEAAYSAFVRRTRADVFDKYLEIAKRSGIDLDKEQLESIGKLVNSLTGRGHLGAMEPVANVVNNLFFSPRMLKSQFDTLFLHPTDKMTPFARKQAAINLLKFVLASAAILTIARTLKKDSVELDPRSANFGKIKIGNTRFDVSGGSSSLMTLIAREASQSSKSSTTGMVNPLNSGKFGSQTGTDVLYSFFENKLSPSASVVKDLMKNQMFDGSKPTLGKEAKNLFAPLGYTNYEELRDDPKAANVWVAMIADALGIATNTYSGNKRK